LLRLLPGKNQESGTGSHSSRPTTTGGLLKAGIYGEVMKAIRYNFGPPALLRLAMSQVGQEKPGPRRTVTSELRNRCGNNDNQQNQPSHSLGDSSQVPISPCSRL